MNIYKIINIIKKVIIYLFKLILFPFFLLGVGFMLFVGCFLADWEDKEDRENYIEDPINAIKGYLIF